MPPVPETPAPSATVRSSCSRSRIASASAPANAGPRQSARDAVAVGPIPTRARPRPWAGSIRCRAERHMASLAGQVAVVTGASSGIGWEMAKVLAAEGCKVGLIARREEPLRKLAADLAAAGHVAAVATADVTDRAQVEAAVASLR